MLLAVKYGASVHGQTADIVVGHHNDGTTLPPGAYPDAVVMPWDGDLNDLDLVGPPPEEGVPDGRFYRAPPVDLVAYAKLKRWETEVGGVVVNGHLFATDDRSKTLLLGAKDSAKEDTAFTAAWDFGGIEIELDAATIIAASAVVRNHVNTVFRTFSTVRAGIADGTIKTMAQIDAAFAAILD